MLEGATCWLMAGARFKLHCRGCHQVLQAEVRRRQTAVLSPEADTAEAGMCARARQQRLSAARTMLSERLTTEAAEAAAKLGGGFL